MLSNLYGWRGTLWYSRFFSWSNWPYIMNSLIWGIHFPHSTYFKKFTYRFSMSIHFAWSCWCCSLIYVCWFSLSQLRKVNARRKASLSINSKNVLSYTLPKCLLPYLLLIIRILSENFLVHMLSPLSHPLLWLLT